MGFRIQLASNVLIEEVELVAEIYWNQDMVACVLSSSDFKFKVEIYPAQSDEPWTFDLDEWQAVLEKAKRRLLGKTQ
jgi:hypothetical protein